MNIRNIWVFDSEERGIGEVSDDGHPLFWRIWRFHKGKRYMIVCRGHGHAHVASVEDRELFDSGIDTWIRRGSRCTVLMYGHP